MVKLIGIDLDDTLLNSSRKVSSYDKEVLKKAHDLGIHIVLTSGRPLVGRTIKYYDELEFLKDDSYFIGYNGGAIYKVKTKEELYSCFLNGKELKRIHTSIDKRFDGLVCHYFHIPGKVKYDLMNQYVYIEKTHNDIEMELFNLSNIKDSDLSYKYMLAGDPDLIKEIYKTIPKDLFNDFNIVISMPCFIEFQSKMVSKWNGLKWLAKYLGIKDDEIMAIGDSGNDLSMVKESKYGVAMANATEEVKRSAKFITSTNDDGGVGKAIEKVLKECNQ